MSHRILIVDDEKNIRLTLSRSLDLEGYIPSAAESGLRAVELVEKDNPDLVLLDLKLPDISGLEVLARIRARGFTNPVVMISGHGSIDEAIKATRLGAFDFIQKPIESERLFLTLRNALRVGELDSEVGALRRTVERWHGMVGASAAMVHLREAIHRAAPTKARVFVTGESGAGKELVAKAIHDLSKRGGGPFVKINCAAIPETLVESELFGHEKGAFTGADRRHQGRFERAHTGTIFLDEIGELPLGVQAKLLRVLQEGEVDRVGGTTAIPVDVRVIAATNRDLPSEVKAGRFREDLYYRLNVVPIRVPALRERLEDVPLLAVDWLERVCQDNDLGSKVFTDDAMQLLSIYTWPGNVRELVHVVERLAILTPSRSIGVDAVRAALHMQGAVLDVHQPSPISATALAPTIPAHTAVADTKNPIEDGMLPAVGKLYELVEQFERRLIEDRIHKFDGNMSKAAEDLGLERSHLYKKIKKLGLTVGALRPEGEPV